MTTISGYAHISTIVDQIKWGVHEVSSQKIKVLLKPQSHSVYNLATNAKCLTIADGSKRLRNDPSISQILEFKLVTKKFFDERNEKKDVPISTVLKLKDRNGHIHDYELGEYAISESMAFLIEDRIYPNVLVRPPDCPYYIVKKIVEKECPHLNDDLMLIAMCDACLMHPFPGVAFYNFIQYQKEINYSLTPELIYFLIVGPALLEKSGVINSYEHTLKEKCFQAKNQLSDYFYPSYWKNNAENIEYIFDEAYKLRSKHPFFMLEIARGGYVFENIPFKYTLGKLG